MARSEAFDRGRKWNWKVIALVLFLHVVLGGLLLNALAPRLVNDALDLAESSLTVVVTNPPTPEPPPPPEEEPDPGNEGEAGERATPREVTAPEPRIETQRSPAPRASSTGNDNSSGNRDDGDGTGAGDSGSGTGAGGEGSGGGAPAIATRPSVRSGSISNARDYAVPPGGRDSRIGTEVAVRFTVGVDGRASGCSVVRSSADAQTAAQTCALVIERIRFNPATDTQGNAVPAPYGWIQRFTARNN